MRNVVLFTDRSEEFWVVHPSLDIINAEQYALLNGSGRLFVAIFVDFLQCHFLYVT